MLNFKRNKSIVPKYLKKSESKTARNQNSAKLIKAKKNIYWQAGLVVITVILTIVIVFAMTSAWYTNIVQTSGLVFEAEAWGFEGTINVNTDPIVAGPGDDGVIHLEVANESENITAVGIHISKARMAPEMQQRLYFYVDTQLTRNNETMNRVYLNNQESYTYTLFGNGQLTLTEETHNDAQLKWQWVYDVLGYYVYGTEVEDEKGNKTVRISEYLRPIEYDYDEATTTFATDENDNPIMVLQTVDGKTTTDEFMVNLSKTDGYEGEIKPEEKLPSGFYPVEVEEDEDKNRYGVYAYLCNYSEIEMATQIDTALGQAAAAAQETLPEGETTAEPVQIDRYEAKLTISAQKNKNSVVNVTSLASLNTAIEMGVADVIQLSGDITVPSDQSLVIAKGQKVMLDLNEYTITSQNPDTAIKVEEGGSLTMINGTIDGTEAKTANGIYAIGAEMSLNNMNVKGCSVGLRVADDDGTGAFDSKVHLVNCAVEATDYAIVVKGNGSDSERLTQMIVEDSTITSDAVGISGNGSADKSGTDIQIINSTVKGNPDKVTTGIFHPQANSKLTVYNSEVSGYTGIAIKGGDVSIIDSKVSGTGAKQAPQFYGSGCADTGDGIYIETNYEGDILLEISGESTITSTYSRSLQVYEPHATNVTVKIYSGTFDEPQPEAYIDENSEQSESVVTKKQE